MAKTRNKTSENCDAAPQPVLNHDVLFLVMMHLGVIDFVAFSGVCKSWRSLALSNRNMFMKSKPPMSIWISGQNQCYLEDLEGRKLKTSLPYIGRTCVGLTCGYLVFFGMEARNFLLMNPITRHELHFPASTILANDYQVRVVLVFSSLIGGWVFVMFNRYTSKIWFCIAGKGAWNHVSSTSPILDLHALKGKIYALTDACRLYELIFYPEPKLTLFKAKDFSELDVLNPEYLSRGEKLNVIDHSSQDSYKVRELYFGEMKWVFLEEKTIGLYAFFFSLCKSGAAIKLEPWGSQYKRYECFLDTNDEC